jgi:hypothetical protein
VVTEANYFLASLNEYRDPNHGLLGDGFKPAEPSGNSLLYEAHAAIIWRDLTGMNYPHVDFYRACSILMAGEGLFFRKPPPAQDEESQDDYIGVAAASKQMASSIVAHGELYGWFYDCFSPSCSLLEALKLVVGRYEPFSYLGLWHGRFPGLKSHYKIGAGLSPSFLGWVAWCFNVCWSVRKKGNESGWLMSYLMLRVANEQFPDHWAVKDATKFFKMQLNEYYFGHIGQVYSAYFGPLHPLTRFAAWPGPPRPCFQPASCGPVEPEKG